MSALLEKLRRCRESVVEAGGHQFTIRRPTEAEQAELHFGGKTSLLDLVRRFVVGWDLQELDLVPGGSPVAVPFDPEVWAEWVNDQPDLWKPISDGVLDAIRTHREKVAVQQKK